MKIHLNLIRLNEIALNVIGNFVKKIIRYLPDGEVPDTHTAGNAKGILVEVETVVPADAPYIWTSTYNDNADNLGVYIGENDGYTDFKCYIVE